ncbi:MAG: DUF1799 domain-containing protein [Xanthobacteraceae bacterium]
MDDATVAAIAGRLVHGETVEVWRENWGIVCAWLAAATQWRTTTGFEERRWRVVWIGLDYAGARAGIDAMGIAVTPELWTGLLVMEAEARAALNGVKG